jgi:hypothetical protein
MKLPAINGIIRRRILLNYRIAPEVVRAILPSNFQPKLVDGYSIAGICLIRLDQIRPKGLPKFIGISSENSAHRIAVEWEDDGGDACEGVFVPRRDTDSRLNSIAGGRIFPGVHHLSNFLVNYHDGVISLQVTTDDDNEPLVDLEVRETAAFPETSVFASLREASEFFKSGCIGYSSRPDSCKLDGLLLKVFEWQVSPLEITRARSSYFDDNSIFPPESIELDHALLMRDIPHEWHPEPEMTTDQPAANKTSIYRRKNPDAP